MKRWRVSILLESDHDLTQWELADILASMQNPPGVLFKVERAEEEKDNGTE